ncbi:phosphoribosylglycinamide formyltransferase [Wansuia hejianensis]|uniref:Phosphoribosylglycinamide formyltransferase n=1 Tax=Wansuia hejianensis TaxID=2763667 RepID=A0A926EWL2_9FIRM|nr:phosphoribosylglycinamide formyltransferase [Wansuia hejianensis]MBC8589820.1 phosphoribosylglycinamide formyltransferase [Wansuia hejianensis]
MLNIGVLISGGGTNLQALIDQINKGNINGKIRLIVSNKEDAYGLVRGRLAGIESIYIDPKGFIDSKEYDLKIMEEFKKKDIDLVVLAGYLKILSKEFIKNFENRIINIHPSLIPSFCGKGYYGKKVHQGVLDYGCKYTGATVHFVDEGTDTGPIILQEIVKVEEDDTLDSISDKVLAIEHEILVKAVKLFCEDKIIIEGRKTKIK